MGNPKRLGVVMNIHYFGHSGFLIETSKSRILIDPFISGNELCTAKPEDIKCDYIILSHGHEDHFGDTEAIAKANEATVIANFEVACYCEELGLKTHPMGTGGEAKFPFGKVKLTIAHHGSSIEDKQGRRRNLGNPNGVLLKVDGKTIYHAGDTGLFLDMKLIGELNSIDLAMLPIGDNFTMGVEDALKAVEFLRPLKAIPIHYNTFPPIKADPEAFAKGVKAFGVVGIALKPNTRFELD